MGQAKTYHEMARENFRELGKAEIQFLMTATALNLKKMVKMLDTVEEKSTLSEKFIANQIAMNFLMSYTKKLALGVSLATSSMGFTSLYVFTLNIP